MAHFVERFQRPKGIKWTHTAKFTRIRTRSEKKKHFRLLTLLSFPLSETHSSLFNEFDGKGHNCLKRLKFEVLPDTNLLLTKLTL